MSYNYQEFKRTNQPRHNRWGKSCPVETPDLPMPDVLNQCQFVMTQIDCNKNPFPVDMWGARMDPKEYGTTSLRDARSFWRDGQDYYFDGYSMALPDQPNPLLIGEAKDEMFVVAGVHENCVTISGKTVKFSNDFMADWVSLSEPTLCFLPNRTGLCWIGLSPQPISGGIKGGKQIDSSHLIVPITDFLITEDDLVSDTWNSPPIKPLPQNAQQIINRILA